ncbi:MAG: hypothetical protein WD512_02005 [Candidatus Paceibacterota bacterium]
MILKIEYLNRIAKFLSLNMSSGEAKDTVIRFHELNCKNYYREVNREYQEAVFSIKDIDTKSVPLISSVQAVSDLEALCGNSASFGMEIDGTTFNEMVGKILEIKEGYDYKIMKKYSDHVLL